jgi:hypothetical protein
MADSRGLSPTLWNEFRPPRGGAVADVAHEPNIKAANSYAAGNASSSAEWYEEVVG